MLGKNWIIGTFVGLSSVLLTACGDEPAKGVAQKAVPKEHVFSTQQHALEKAKALELQLQQSAEQQRLQIESQTQN